MDAISDILNLIKLKSSVYFRKDFLSPWGMEMDKSPHAQFHLVVWGHCYLKTGQMKKPVELYTGDIVVFPNGDSHWLADNTGNKLVAGSKVLESHRKKKQIFKGSRISTTLVCGHFEFDKDYIHPFLQSLPKLIHISGTERRRNSWIETVASIIIQETESDVPGSEIITTRLAEVLFIHILRVYLQQSKISNGFLAALKDEQINHALALIHKYPNRRWTLENIARIVGMSRSAFAAKFKEVMGITPMNYLTNWRLNKALELIKNKKLPMIEIAEQVGYSSEAAFGRAFKKQFNRTPVLMKKEYRKTLAS